MGFEVPISLDLLVQFNESYMIISVSYVESKYKSFKEF